MPQLVDRATYSSRRGRPTQEQVDAWKGLARAFAAAVGLQEKALRGTDLDLSEYDVLVTLAVAPPEGVRPSDLAERALLTKSGITRLLDRLEGRGLVERHACPTDKRGQLISITAGGRRLQRRAAPALIHALSSAFSPLATADLAALRRAGERLSEVR